jgi:hypothetical protein
MALSIILRAAVTSNGVVDTRAAREVTPIRVLLLGWCGSVTNWLLGRGVVVVANAAVCGIVVGSLDGFGGLLRSHFSSVGLYVMRFGQADSRVGVAMTTSSCIVLRPSSRVIWLVQLVVLVAGSGVFLGFGGCHVINGERSWSVAINVSSGGIFRVTGVEDFLDLGAQIHVGFGIGVSLRLE